MIAAVLMVRKVPTAEASLAAMRAFNRFGMAIAAMIKIIATTISSSISEKPVLLSREWDAPAARAFAFLFRGSPLKI